MLHAHVPEKTSATPLIRIQLGSCIFVPNLKHFSWIQANFYVQSQLSPTRSKYRMYTKNDIEWIIRWYFHFPIWEYRLKWSIFCYHKHYVLFKLQRYSKLAGKPLKINVWYKTHIKHSLVGSISLVVADNVRILREGRYLHVKETSFVWTNMVRMCLNRSEQGELWVYERIELRI